MDILPVKNMKKQIRQGLEDNKKYNYIWTYMINVPLQRFLKNWSTYSWM